ncbi:LPXTG-motif cell wall anchor domain-containing protein [Edaphobacillus lindanitolerans]|uniref:LPXTG-motif cell wall anchor domain-containing protein n=1 Tax=Edaphobacillus lindanitolerans TaxID=550447 RepID=A0A1U7PNN3_9BACI|nr:LPXTG-motif cell wall anchor domain-containing protein [Edaphobacillus lindanitolerans]
MRKKFNLFALALLVMGHTLFGPILPAFAETGEVPETVSVQEVGGIEAEGQEEPAIALPETPKEEPALDEDKPADPVNQPEDDPSTKPETKPAPGQTEDKPSGSEAVEEKPATDNPEAQEAVEEKTIEKDSDEETDEKGTEKRAAYDLVMPESVIKEILVTINGAEVEDAADVRNGDNVRLEFKLELGAGHNYGPGTTLTYKLPEVFRGATFSEGNKFGELGTMSMDGQNLIITFNDAIRDELGQGTAIEPGSFFFITASISSTGDNWEEVIVLPGEKTITLNFQPVGGTFIEKSGTPDNGGKNSKEIDWTVNVNTNLGESSETLSFTDTLTADHEIIPDSVHVQELIVRPDGSISDGPAVNVRPTFTQDGMSFNLPNSPKKAYKINYKTVITDAGDEESKNFGNTANVNGKPATKSVSVNFGKPLAKSGAIQGDLSTEWTIHYNFNNRLISKENAKLTDSWTVSGGSGDGNHSYVDGSFVVYEEDGKKVPSSAYSFALDGNGQGFTLRFHDDVNTPRVIKYKTEPKDHQITSDVTVKNTVKREDNNKSADASVTYFRGTYLLDKWHGKLNYEDKTISWIIRANTAGYTLPAGTIFDDVFIDGLLELDQDSLHVTVDGRPFSGYTLEGVSKSGFKLILTEAIDKEIVIQYTTKYDIRDIGKNNREYRNEITIKNGGMKEDPKAGHTVKVNDNQKNNGYKKGHYNYETKTFHWEVVLNYNLNELNNAVFQDILPETQELKGPVLIQEVQVQPDGGLKEVGTAQPVNNEAGNDEISLSFGKLDKAYKITYTTVDKDGVFPETNGDVTIKNKATLSSDAGPNAEWSASVKVKHTDKVIKKFGEGVRPTERIKWNFELNYSQSELHDVLITDTVGKDDNGSPDQLYLEDSFKVYQVKMTGTTADGGPKMSKEPVDEGLYTLNIDPKKGTFTLAFKQPIKEAYYVEYETIFLAPSGSDVSNEIKVSYNSTEGSEGSDSTLIKNYQYGSAGNTVKVPFKVIKTDKDTKEPIEGVVFTLYNKNNLERALISGSTDENGIWDLGFSITEGEYVLKEIQPAEGYAIPADFEFKLDRNEKERDGKHEGFQLVKVTNEKLNHSFKVQKVDENGQGLPGAVFALKTEDGQPVEGHEKLVSGEGGWIEVEEQLTPGEYQLVETKAPNGYLLLEEPVWFTIDDQQTSMKTLDPIRNEVAPGASLQKLHENPDGTLDRNRPLQGAEFHLYQKDGDGYTRVDDTVYVTDENGELHADNLQNGAYQFVEVKAPKGYELDDTPVGFSIPAEGKKRVVLDVGNKKHVPLKVNKTDVDTKEPIAGVQFELYAQENLNDPLVAGETDEAGVWEVRSLIEGNYVLKEVRPADGYADHLEVIEITLSEGSVSDDGYQVVKVTNKKLNRTFKVQKVDENGQGLPGAEFTLQTGDGQPVERHEKLVSGEGGWIEVKEQLAPGEYQLVETKAPKGYLLLEEPVRFAIDDQQTSIKILDPIHNEVAPGASLRKFHENPDGTLDRERPLQGAEFHLYKKDGEGFTRVDDTVYVTDENGELHAEGLQYGAYQFVEVKAPAGYELDETPVGFLLSAEDEKPVVLDVGNKRLVPLKVIKTDVDTNEPIAGVQFELYAKEDQKEPLFAGETDEDGIWEIRSLIEGDYVLKEVRPADGYADHLEDIAIKLSEESVSDNGHQVVKVTNAKLNHTFKVQKVDENGEGLAGAEFALLTEDGQPVAGHEHLVSGEDGWIEVKEQLTPGTYQLVETKAPKGYLLLQEPVRFTIDDQQTSMKTLEPISNEVAPGASLRKFHENPDGSLDQERPLQGAEFHLYQKDGEGFTRLDDTVYVTDENGELHAEGLQYGAYQFVEVKAPKGYELDGTPVGFLLSAEDEKPVVLDVGNKRLVPFKVIKTDADTNEPIAGVQFELYAKENQNEPLAAGETDESGVWEVRSLTEGDYVLKEVRPAAGYADHLEDIEIKLSEESVGEDGHQVVKVENKKLVRLFEARKVDESGNPLAGVEFELRNENGEPVEGVETLVSDNDGWVRVSQPLEPGHYQLIETKPLKGYEPLEEPIEFTIDDQQTEVKDIGPIVNTVIPGAFLEKYHADDEGNLDLNRPLENAQFHLYKQDEDGNYQLVKNEDDQAAVYVTDENGEFFTGHLDDGNYQFIESLAPSGYSLDETPILFSIPAQDGKPVILQIGNKQLRDEGGTPPPTTDPEGPVDPAKPGTPTDPNKPNIPGKPVNPDKPAEKPVKPGNDNSANGGKLPQTGEEQFMYLFGLGAVLAIAGGWLLIGSRRKRA